MSKQTSKMDNYILTDADIEALRRLFQESGWISLGRDSVNFEVSIATNKTDFMPRKYGNGYSLADAINEALS
jgi:hypothetical protein